jgi:hypothetical protein
MTQSAAVVAPAPLDLAAMLDRWVAAWRMALIDCVWHVGRRIADRILAKFAYHDSTRYRELIRRAATHIGPLAEYDATELNALVREVRRLDPGGLGVWYLAHTPRELDLTELCRCALAAPRAGPPRAVARWLGRALGGDPIWWSVDSYWFDVLASQTLIYAAVGAAQAALHLTSDPDQTQCAAGQAHLLAAGNSLQTVARAYARAFDQQTPVSPDAAGLAYQALNGLRRLLNQTDLTAADEQLAGHAARLAIQTAQTACSAVLAITSKRLPPPPDSFGVRERLAALARSVDALTSRVPSSPGESADVSTRATWSTQARRVLAATSAVLAHQAPARPTDRPGSAPDPSAKSLGSAALAEASAVTLDAWAWIHEWSDTASEQDSAPIRKPQETFEVVGTVRKFSASSSGNPPYVRQLVAALTGRLPTSAILAAVRGLAATGERSLPAAACIAALCRGTGDLPRELWGLIQAGDTSAKEKSLAFQLWRRLGVLRPPVRNVGEAR